MRNVSRLVRRDKTLFHVAIMTMLQRKYVSKIQGKKKISALTHWKFFRFITKTECSLGNKVAAIQASCFSPWFCVSWEINTFNAPGTQKARKAATSTKPTTLAVQEAA